MNAYRLLQPMPGLPEGVIFVHDRDNVSGNGNEAYGCMVLAWDNAKRQTEWDGETFFLPGQLADNTEWFAPIQNPLVKHLNSRRPRYHICFTKMANRDIRVIKAMRGALDQIEGIVKPDDNDS